jgi:uncharacterized protein YbjT (DUF2867 family)
MKVILFGATGMVGQAVLRECLLDDAVDAILSIGRRSSEISSPRLREIIRPDLFDFSIDKKELAGYDACLFCLGVSSLGMNEAVYKHLTLDLTLGWAQLLADVNPNMTFVYVSGAGTGGRARWAQIKVQTENALSALFPSSYMIRLGGLMAVNGEVSKTRWTRIGYSLVKPILPVVRAFSPSAVISTEELGRAMVRAARSGAPKRILENRDLASLGSAVH